MERYYDKIISLDNINKAYKDYALILKITNSPNINNYDKVKSLKPFLTSPSEFQPIASELEILYLIENKKIKRLFTRWFIFEWKITLLLTIYLYKEDKKTIKYISI